jgi:hypothetical protein
MIFGHAERAIRERTRKFVFVTSRASNQKQGPLQELAVANDVARQVNDQRFIIPLKIDDLPYAESNIQIHRLISLNFTAGWAEGLATLLKTLEEEGVPKPKHNGASEIASWWNAHKLNRNIIRSRPQSLWTNWFPLRGLPRYLYVWDIPEAQEAPCDLPFPVYRAGTRLFSFADGEALDAGRGMPLFSCRCKRVFLNLRREPPSWAQMTRAEVAIAVKGLIVEGWAKIAEDRELPQYEFSRKRKALWFPKGKVQGESASFIGADGRNRRRGLCGYRTVGKVGSKYTRQWHFGLEAVPILYPSPALALKPHVLFTRDGKTISGDAKFQHRARRSQCKAWWNDKWRDLILAAVSWLSQRGWYLPLPLTPQADCSMHCRPLRYLAPVSYKDADVRLSQPEMGGNQPMPEDDEETDIEPT